MSPVSIAIILATVVLASSGCSSMMGFVYPYTDHARCIQRCEEKLRGTYEEVVCRDRCDRELGNEMSRDRNFVPEKERNSVDPGKPVP
jgi:hypothetical protein